MRPLPLSESIRLPESAAVQRRLDDLNWSWLRWTLLFFACGALIGSLITLFEDDFPLQMQLAWASLFVASAAFLLLRRRAFVERSFRNLLIGYLVLLFAVLQICSPDTAFSYALGGFLAPFVLMFFRFKRGEIVGLSALCLATAIWFALNPAAETSPPWGAQVGMSIGALVGVLLALIIGSKITNRIERRFLIEWRLEYARVREQTRMREEFNDARQIQLSMLPHEAPQLGWIDLASVSLPATEVGGDYFDYVPLDSSRLAVVVGDVAGHGMASGLVLAAIRGGLHLLREELAEPLRALQRLDRMVQEIAPGRMYVTLQIAVLDHQARRVTLVSAGHPPAFHYSATTGETRELGGAAVPLGTRLESRLVEQSAELGAGDVLVFYTDGIPEATDLHNEMFGDHRIREALDRSATGRSAAEIRTLILETVNRFKGDVELRDDLTLVVAKLSG